MVCTRLYQLILGCLALSIFWPSGRVLGASTACQPTQTGSQLCQIPVKVGANQRPFFYEVRRSIGNNPTIIVIPGGPGQGLIGSLKSVVHSDQIPDELGVILIDPRGFGKNDFGKDQDGAIYSSSSLASDIAAVIGAENLQNYFIHGQSYGTVVATVLGHQIEELKLPHPKAIILSGVAEGVFEDPLAGYNDQIQRLMESYSAADQVKLKTNLAYLQSQFHENQRVFAVLWINTLPMNSEDPMSDGVNNVNMRKFFDAVRDGDWMAKNQTLQFFLETAKGLPMTKLPINKARRNDMAETIKCRELTGNDGMWDVSFDVKSMRLRTGVMDCQEKGYRLENPYDSAKYQIRETPLVYIQGRLDPATPWKEALLHFRNQQTRQKAFILLNLEAHTGLSGLWRCRSQFWDHMNEGPNPFVEYLSRCSPPGSTVIQH